MAKPELGFEIKGFAAASTLIDAVKKGAVKDVNHVISSAAFDSRKLAQRAVNFRVKEDNQQTLKAVYFKTIRRSKGGTISAYIRIGQAKWNWLRWAVDGGRRKSHKNVKAPFVAIPSGRDQATRGKRKRLYKFAKTVREGGRTETEMKSRRRSLVAVPLRKDPDGKLVLLKVLRRGKAFHEVLGWLKKSANYPNRAPDIKGVAMRIVDRMMAKNADRVFGTNIRREVRKNARKPDRR